MLDTLNTKIKNVLVIGRGGREHAICLALKKSTNNLNVFVACGNAGTKEFCTNADINELNNIKLVDFAIKNNIDLTIVGPENALMNGIVNAFQEKGLLIFGPTKEAALIEGSKQFAKDLMKANNVPTADYQTFTDFDKAYAYVKTKGAPIVIKYDGLASGKGVVVAKTLIEAEEALKDMLINHKYTLDKVVIEEFLEGEEFSLMALVNGENITTLPVAKDHKRAFDNDEGGNTGGMGAFSPVDFVTDKMVEDCKRTILTPVVKAMAQMGINFVGILYAGLILTKDGVKVIEFNARFGDPETQVVLPRIKNNFDEVIMDCLNNNKINLKVSDKVAVGVVMASKGYPESFDLGYDVEYDRALASNIYHMGTRRNSQNQIVTNGGRVLLVCALGKNIETARQETYKIVKNIKCENLFYRTDIAKKRS